MTESLFSWRLAAMVVVLTGLWGGLAGRLAYLQLWPKEALREAIRREHAVQKELPVGRGRILDCRGSLLAQDLPTMNVCADPQEIIKSGQLRAITLELARRLQMDPAGIFWQLNRPTSRYQRLQRFVTTDRAREIEQLKLKGVFLEESSARHYPQERMMSHVLGFANLEGVGSAGLEQRLESFLRGRPDVLEKALDETMRVNQAKGAWAIVERVRTGAILAMAGRPDYSPNDYRHAPTNALRNNAIGYSYEPGSTFKLATIAAALDAGTVTPETLINCENGKWLFHGKLLHDYHPYGLLSVADIIKKSSNIGAAKIALTLGEERLEQYLRVFGFGRPTGIDLPGEESGLLRPVARWTPLSISRIPMGHEVMVTSLQVLNALCCIANEGRLMQPYVVQRVVDPRGRVISQGMPRTNGCPIRADTARLMCRLLTRVTEPGGTGAQAAVTNYTVAGKTGTAVKVVDGKYVASLNIASFAGFLPAEKPELAIMVVVDEPQPLHTGGLVAAPVFRDVAAQVIRYFDIPPAGEQHAGAGAPVAGGRDALTGGTE
ncbi:MAG: penicillin-binding protein 2 [Kiritimatiellaeota bacterium]|nr:penicillin-binding protein 2 [Kiritimatiellota bacterium]